MQPGPPSLVRSPLSHLHTLPLEVHSQPYHGTQYSAIVKTHTALHGTMQSRGELACFGILEL